MSKGITESALDDALAQSFPASDPLPINPGTDLTIKWQGNRLRTSDADELRLRKTTKPKEAADRAKLL